MERFLFKIFIEQLPEAIFFSLFIIFAKGLKEKRAIFIFLTSIEYLLLLKWQPYGIYSRIGFFIITFIILKMLYQEKSQITDVFLLGIASLIIIISCFIPSFLIIFELVDYKIYAILTRFIIFGILFLIKNNIKDIQKLYKKLWNRNDKVKKKIKSTTFRSANLFIFNFMFFIINCGLAFAIYFNNK